MREFTKADYEIYASAEDFIDGDKALIHELTSGLDIVADRRGVWLYGFVGTKAVAYELYKSLSHIKKSAEVAANEWIDALEDLKKHEQIALLNNIGIKCVG